MASLGVYAAIVKNLRGVVVVDTGDPEAVERVRWLIKRFRYRSIGVVPSQAGSPILPDKQPFIRLVYPIEPLSELPGILSRAAGLPVELAEALVLASAYVSPLLVSGNKYINALRGIACHEILVCRSLSDSEWKLHLRIADYTVLDMYRALVEEASRAIEDARRGTGIDEILAARRDRARADEKRYWRILCRGGEEGEKRVFMLYIDNLMLLAKAINEGVIDRRRLRSEYSMALSIVPAVNITI